MRLIDADKMATEESEAFIVAQSKVKDGGIWLINEMVHSKIQMLIADTPTVNVADVVPVVRCEDCRKFKTYKCPMVNLCTYEDFCSYGERKDND